MKCSSKKVPKSKYSSKLKRQKGTRSPVDLKYGCFKIILDVLRFRLEQYLGYIVFTHFAGQLSLQMSFVAIGC